MKRLLFILSALCIVVCALALAGSVTTTDASNSAQQQQGWSDPWRKLSGVVVVPRESMMGTDNSDMSKLWGPLNPPVFGPNVDATLNNSANQNETTISIYPANNQRVIAAANDYRANLQPWVYLSTDGGTSWSNYQVPGTTSLYYGDPAMAFGPDNNKAYFSYLGYTAICNAAGGMYVSRSDDAGSAFTPPLQLAANTNDGQICTFQDKEIVAADRHPGSPNYRNAYVAWTHYVFNAAQISEGAGAQIEAPAVLSRSTDQGITWSVPITVSPVFSNNSAGVVPATGNNGEVYVYYLGAATPNQLNVDTVLFARSTDGGLTFPFFTHIASVVDIPSPLPGTQFRDNAYGAMAVDRVMNGYLYAVWSDYRNGDADILLSRSTDNGTTWGAPQRVNDDAVGNGKDQYFPWIASSEDGLVHISWHDEREGSGAQYKDYYTYTSDHGATWATNVAVATAPSNPGSSTFIGDYSGIDAVAGVVMPVWTDIRAGANQNVYTARGVKGGQSTATVTPQVTSTGTFPVPTTTPTGTPTFPSATPIPPSSTPTNTGTATPTVCGVGWQTVPSPNMGSSILQAVSEAPAGDVWAVGTRYDTSIGREQTLIMHYTGNQWQIVPSPNVGTEFNRLTGVAAISSNDVWAVGYYAIGSRGRTLVEHWGGSAWSVVASPNVGTLNNQLFAVAAVSSSDAWAVGEYTDGTNNPQTLTLHYTSGQWVVIPNPTAGEDSRLLGVAARTANDAWAVGWDATGSNIEALTMHYTGGQWVIVPAPKLGGVNALFGVTVVGPDDMWAVGMTNGSGQAAPLHYTNGQWQASSIPGLGNSLVGIYALSSDNVWAVGHHYESGGTTQSLTAHYTSGQWQVVDSPNPGTNASELNGVAAVSPSDVWAVGVSSGNGSGLTWTLRYFDPCVTPTPSPIGTFTNTPTNTPTAIASHTTGPTQTPGGPTATPEATATACTLSFSDVPPDNAFYTYIRCLVCRGIISGYDDGTFRPGNDITRGQIAKIVSPMLLASQMTQVLRSTRMYPRVAHSMTG